jgi:hypothetical protein
VSVSLRMTAPSRGRLVHVARAAGVASLLLAAAACHRRPDFDSQHAQQDIAAALDKQARDIAVYEENRGDTPDEWIVEFQPNGFRETLQARFRGVEDRWELVGMRTRSSSGGPATEWEDVGAMLGKMRRENVEKAAATREIMTDLANWLERYSIEHGNHYPLTTAGGLQELFVGGQYVQQAQWNHSGDAWGNGFTYHAAPDATSYILISPGADSALDRSEDEYFANADAGNEAYQGRTTDAARDFIIASGSFVQGYEP